MPHVIVSNSKCTGCHMCELACSAWHEGAYRPSVARLSVTLNATTGSIHGHTCLQTACAKCQQACPSDAITTREVTVGSDAGGEEVSGQILVVNEESCTDCGACYTACPTGVMRRHPERGVAVKCDLCGGEPQCIAFCQNPYVMAMSLKMDKAHIRLTR